MKKNKLICIVLLFVLVLCTENIVTVYAKEEINSEMNDDSHVTDELLIRESVDCLNSKDYTNRLSYFGESYQNMLVELMENVDNFENKIGFYNVENINIISIKKLAYTNIYLDQYESASKEAEDIVLYAVTLEVDAYSTSEFYDDGIRTDVYAVGSLKDERKIISIRKATEPIILHTSNGISSYDAYIGECFTFPEQIKVQKSNNQIVSVDFKLYCKRVVAKEVGYDSWGANYHKSCALAAKNYALHKILTCSPDLGYHILATESNQVYDENINYNGWPNLMNALEQTWNQVIVDSKGYCVNTEYRSGTKPEHEQYDRASSGKLIQKSAKNMSDNGASYSQILSYFYSNSPEASGTIILKNCNAPHIWVNYGNYKKCRKCGKIEYETYN